MKNMDAVFDEITRELADIHNLLRHLPEIQAAVFLQMQEEARAAAIQGGKPSDIWEIATPDQR